MSNITAKSISSNLSDAEKQVVRDNIEAAPLASPSLTGTPTAPTAATGDDSTKLATTEFVKAKSESDSIGVNQTWQNVTASRASGVIYTNNTGKPIMISFSPNISGGAIQYWSYVDGVEIGHVYRYANATNDAFTFIVPSGSTYEIDGFGADKWVWSELR